MIRTTLIGLSLSATLALGLAGCTSPSSTPATPTAAPTQAAGALDFETVERFTEPRFKSDPECVAGEWSPNSTGVDEEYRSAVATFQQYDCYANADDVGQAIPDRVQQSMYVEFNDADTARRYAEDEGSYYKALLDQNRVVVAGTGLDSVDMQAYLEEIKAACNCGEIIAP